MIDSRLRASDIIRNSSQLNTTHQVLNMKFTRVAAFFVAFIGLIAVVAASPAVKRQDLLSTVLSLVLGLVNTVLSLLGELLENNNNHLKLIQHHVQVVSVVLPLRQALRPSLGRFHLLLTPQLRPSLSPTHRPAELSPSVTARLPTPSWSHR